MTEFIFLWGGHLSCVNQITKTVFLNLANTLTILNRNSVFVTFFYTHKVTILHTFKRSLPILCPTPKSCANRKYTKLRRKHPFSDIFYWDISEHDCSLALNDTHCCSWIGLNPGKAKWFSPPTSCPHSRHRPLCMGRPHCSGTEQITSFGSDSKYFIYFMCLPSCLSALCK